MVTHSAAAPADDAEETPQYHYFHGTKAPLRRGDMVLPRRIHGGPATNAPLTPGGTRLPESDDYVYVTNDYNFAWACAYESGALGEPVVLVVKPQGNLELDPEHSAHMGAYRCEAALVLAVDNQAPFDAEAAKKGWRAASDTPTRQKGLVRRQE